MFVSEIIDDVLEVLGISDKKRAYSRITKAVKALQDEGDWNANIGGIDIKTDNDQRTISLPPEIETPLAVSVAGRPVFMRDEFFKFHLNGDGFESDPVTGKEPCGVPWAWDDRGAVPSFLDIITAGALIAISDLNSDANTIVRLLGKDENGRDLRTQQLDGSWIDGVEVIARPITDYAGGVITQPTTRNFRRNFVITPMTTFSAVTKHELATGAYMQTVLQTGSMPEPLIDGAYYYIRIADDYKITLHKTRLDSRTGQAPIEIVSTVAGSVVRFLDKRGVTARTQFQSSTDNILTDYDLVTFLGAPLPLPLDSNSTYVVRMNGSNKFSIFENKDDAVDLVNVINVTTPGSSVLVRALKAANPVTTLNFSVRHNMLTNDSVTIENTGGELPTPIVAGAVYFVYVLTNSSMTLHTTLSDSSTGQNPIALTSLGSGTNSVVKIIPASASIGNVNNISAPNHNLNSPVGSGATATVQVSGGNVTGLTVVNGGSGYEVAPTVVINPYLGSGSGAVVKANLSGGVVTSFTVVAQGSGYTTSPAPTATISAAAGSFVRFSTTGSLPPPIDQGTVYRAEAPMSANTFTLNDTTPAPISISGLGSGSLFLVISRTFSVGFIPQFQVNATNYQTGQEIRFFSSGVLPTASPSIDQSTIYYIRKLSNTEVEIYDTSAHAINTASTIGRINILTLGVGQLYLSKEDSATAINRDNFLDLEYSGYLQNLADIKFETSGTLPAPLVAGTTYQLSIVEGLLQVRNSGGTVITLTTIGSGIHSMLLQRDLSVDLSTSLDIVNQQFSTGDTLKVETDGILPSPLTTTNTYYARPISEDKVELYDTLLHAQNIAATTGRLTYLSSGTDQSCTIQVLSAVKVSSTLQIEKAITDGYVTLYAWDTGREGSLTLLAIIAPEITNPIYRRIRVGVKNTWVRMRYRRRSLKISGDRDFINLDSDMAVIMMVKSHELLFKNFADEAEDYRKVAVDYLNKRDRAIEGPRVSTMQFNADIMTNPNDMMVD